MPLRIKLLLAAYATGFGVLGWPTQSQSEAENLIVYYELACTALHLTIAAPLGVWAACGHGRWYLRLVAAFGPGMAIVIVFLCQLISLYRSSGMLDEFRMAYGATGVLVLLDPLLLQATFIMAPVAIAFAVGLAMRWQGLRWTRSADDAAPRIRTQFSLRLVFVAVAIAALLLGIKPLIAAGGVTIGARGYFGDIDSLGLGAPEVLVRGIFRVLRETAPITLPLTLMSLAAVCIIDGCLAAPIAGRSNAGNGEWRTGQFLWKLPRCMQYLLTRRLRRRNVAALHRALRRLSTRVGDMCQHGSGDHA